MMRYLIPLLAGLAAAVVTATPLEADEPASGKVIFEDSFDGQLKPGWIINNVAPRRLRVTDQTLDMWIAPESGAGARNVLHRPVETRQCVVEVTLTSLSPPTQQYEQAGIYWLVDGKVAFKFVKERIDGVLYVFPGKIPMDAATVQMRLIVDGTNVTAMYRPDAEGEFRKAAEGSLPAEGKDSVGLQCWHGPPDSAHWVRFDDFLLRERGNP